MPELNRSALVLRYNAGVSIAELARELKVSPGWLARQFDGWKVPRRGRAEAARLRGQPKR